MAKSFVTGAARGPSSDEFKERMARLSPQPTQSASAGATRAPRGKGGKAAFPFQRSEPAPEETPGGSESAGSEAADHERDGGTED